MHFSRKFPIWVEINYYRSICLNCFKVCYDVLCIMFFSIGSPDLGKSIVKNTQLEVTVNDDKKLTSLARAVRQPPIKQQNSPPAAIGGQLPTGSTRNVAVKDRRSAGYTCYHCEASYRYPGHLRQHIEKLHHGEMPYKCSTCGFQFACLNDIEAHMLEIHLSKSPFTPATGDTPEGNVTNGEICRWVAGCSVCNF